MFAPEYSAGFFGGDPDNFNFPRWNFDMGVLRVSRDGTAIAPKESFPINAAGAQDGELVMTLGHPGTTQRLLTVAQLETQRDLVLPTRLMVENRDHGTSTEVLIRDLRVNPPLDARLFSVKTLQSQRPLPME